jgi:hypothetical protein
MDRTKKPTEIGVATCAEFREWLEQTLAEEAARQVTLNLLEREFARTFQFIGQAERQHGDASATHGS